jgi:hypothetical protein
VRQIVDAAGWKQQAAGGHIKPGGVGNRRHLDGRFGTVEEGIEHLRVHAGRLRLARGEPVVLPDAVGRHVVIGGQVFRALAGGDDAETRGARPVHHLRCQRRLVAIGERIDHARLARFLGEQGSCQYVGPRH